MGLDMYLEARKYFRDDWVKEGDDIIRDPDPDTPYKKIKSLLDINIENSDSPSIHVSVTVACWRKANHIHGWFVRNVQEDIDDCKDYYVSREQLQELIGVCKEALQKRTKQHERLPITHGFAFGAYSMGDWYWEDIELTINQLEEVLNKITDPSWSFYYRASW
jgi:hypothetical protein